MKLYEIAGQMQHVLQLIDQADGEMPAEVVAQLDALEMDLADKVKNICHLHQHYASMATADNTKGYAMPDLDIHNADAEIWSERWTLAPAALAQEPEEPDEDDGEDDVGDEEEDDEE